MDLHKLLLSVGSNLNDRKLNILTVFNEIKSNDAFFNCRISDLYESEPLLYSEQPWFLNAAIFAETYLNPQDLINYFKELEVKIGRVKRTRWHEREIDIDIIFYDDLVLNSESLVIPHPGMSERKFVLLPAADLCPDYIHPVFKKSVRELLEACSDKSIIRKYNQ